MISIKSLEAGTPPKHTGYTAETNQKWYGGLTAHGESMPFEKDIQINMISDTFFNQGQPLMLSAEGQVIWSEAPFKINYLNKQLSLTENHAEFNVTQAGSTLKDAHAFASTTYFPPSGKMPDELLFSAPQYNTWIELMYEQNQEDILAYAKKILDNGMPPGVLMIDDNWQENYGVWDFHAGRFTDPKAMIDELHEMGFKVMLWVAPFVSPDSQNYRKLAKQGVFLKRSQKHDALPQMVDWWNGVSALLDFSNPEAVTWFDEQLKRLQNDYGVDGFKFDAGDAHFYQDGYSKANITPNQQSELFAQIGLHYPLNELRATWKLGGQPIAQRLKDKNHDWSDLEKLIPQMNLEGILGYPFACPDMIGGGEYLCFLDGADVDQELVVRSAQAHALMPMMQFSVAPWRVLDENNLAAVVEAVNIRQKFSQYIVDEARKSAETGEPIMRMMEYDYPHQGYHSVKDQFLIGESLLVAPVVHANQTERTVKIPNGTWISNKGETHIGPLSITEPVTASTLLYYQKQ
ncbi:glycoside hydrolase [Parashewanella spongiae]|uniref:Glycoside hydrolase n=1 Tax=Parashewanella spongiae TaxID=342950 RepID=A0A3A6T875_9GAMM|nr:glycoside hydrolase family 31 protein [Parashewanella spongiae]MCL1079117.1 glycoside hydrolase family 31 protein [Parashewanella spongiae]RJY10724.1 glycoside hydrolase [Parashewanella spongiae]